MRRRNIRTVVTRLPKNDGPPSAPLQPRCFCAGFLFLGFPPEADPPPADFTGAGDIRGTIAYCDAKSSLKGAFCQILWRCGELDPGPNLAMKENLRRIVSVIFKTGCEERRRNHSCPIPYLSVPAGIPDTDPTDDSTPPSCCRNQGR